MNQYDSSMHQRRSIRLTGYDYSQAGLYFITICCQNKICRFGYIENGQMIFSIYGQIAHNEWMNLPKRFPIFELDFFQIMPSHFHGIISLNAVGAGFTPAQNACLSTQNADHLDQNDQPIDQPNLGQPQGIAPTTVSKIIGAYKSLVANECLKIYKTKNGIMGKFWQRNYYEHIIRNEGSYHQISDYIISNPANWTKDKFHLYYFPTEPVGGEDRA